MSLLLENTNVIIFREVGDIGLFITLVPNDIMTFSYSLAKQPWGLLLNLICWFIKLIVSMFQPLIVIYRRVILCIRSGGDIGLFITLVPKIL